MANRNNPFGLESTGRTIDGGEPVIRKVQKDASEAGVIYINDLVQLEADGNIEADSITPGTSRYLGVALNYGAAATLTDHLVIVSPKAEYVIQSDADATGLLKQDVGATINVEYGAGSATGAQRSKSVADRSAGAPDSTATKDFKITGWFDAVDNEEGQYARVLVIINKHVFSEEIAGI